MDPATPALPEDKTLLPADKTLPPEDGTTLPEEGTAATRAAETPPQWPRIADYWPAESGGPLPETQASPAEPKPGRRWANPIFASAVAVVVFAGSAVAGHRLITRPTAAVPSPASTTDAPSPSAPAPSSSPVGGPATLLPPPSASASASRASPAPTTKAEAATGSFDLVSDLSKITVRTARLGSGIARVDAPRGSNAVPRLRVRGTSVQLAVSAGKGDGPTTAVVLLDDRLAWSVRIRGGVRQADIDLTGTTVRRIDLAGGADRIDLTLPRLRDAVPIRMSGGVHTWNIRTTDRADVRLASRRGAGKVVVYGRDRGSLSPGADLTTDSRSGGRLDLDAQAGFGSLTVSER